MVLLISRSLLTEIYRPIGSHDQWSRWIVKYSQVPKIRDSYACIRRFSKKKIQRLSLPLYRNLTVSSEGGRGIDSDLYKRLPAPTPPTSPCPVLFVEISDPAVFGILFMSESSKQCFEAWSCDRCLSCLHWLVKKRYYIFQTINARGKIYYFLSFRENVRRSIARSMHLFWNVCIQRIPSETLEI